MNEKLQPKIFVVVLNFNGENTLVACLSSIYQSDYLNFEVVVVDNDSKDGSLEQAKKDFSRAHFIKNPTNLGFSRGNNLGIRWALEKFADYIFILNNDTIVEKTTLSSLVSAMNDDFSVGIASPIIFNANNTGPWFAGGEIYWQKMKTGHLLKIKSDKPYPTEYISGCAMFVRKDVFKKIGLFDERFFLYYEDTDFSLQAKNAGFKLIMVPLAHIKHLEQSTALNKLKIYWLVLSGLIFFQKNASFFQKIWLLVYVNIRKIKNFYDLVFSRSDAALSVHKAYQDFKKIYKIN